MSFITDKQTLDDLNLVSRHRPGSVYSLFDQLKTIGGERLLDEYFRNPLTDVETINQRTAIFGYLQERDYQFPFHREQARLVEEYLGGPKVGGRLASAIDMLRRKMMASLLKDEQYGLIAEGVRNTMEFVGICREFVRQFAPPGAGSPGDGSGVPAKDSPIHDHIETLRSILDDPRLSDPAPTMDMGWQKIAAWHHLFRQVLSRRLNQLCHILYELDLYISISRVAREKGFSYARAVPPAEHRFSTAELRHPCLPNAIGNELSLDSDSNLLFLTGANMAGKSTFMKAFGISVYLAHMGFPVAARDMVFSVKEGLSTSINVPDDLTRGYSHFYAEVQRVKNIADAVSEGKNMVVIFDELFKGTNVKDAFDATLAVTDAFADYPNCLFLISTHITEVGESLRIKRGNLQFACLPTVLVGSRPTYPYRLKEGISADRHGMMIIVNEGILEIIEGSLPISAAEQEVRPA